RADPLTAAFVAVVAAGLAYELVLALTVPPNNWDSLTYHLTRVAGWHQAHGVHWIANAPTGRINEFQPLAEQLILFLFVSGTTALYALPQYVAQLAILVAVYGAARRLGYEPRAAARGTAVLATLSLVALESTTAQNDLVAASFPIAAAFFLLRREPLEALLAGLALGVGLGSKLTIALAFPVLAVLAWRGGRRTTALVAGGRRLRARGCARTAHAVTVGGARSGAAPRSGPRARGARHLRARPGVRRAHGERRRLRVRARGDGRAPRRTGRGGPLATSASA